jgi:hypothetical protein
LLAIKNAIANSGHKNFHSNSAESLLRLFLQLKINKILEKLTAPLAALSKL